MRAKEGTPVATSVAFILWQKFVAIPKSGGSGGAREETGD